LFYKDCLLVFLGGFMSDIGFIGWKTWSWFETWITCYMVVLVPRWNLVEKL